MSTLSYFLILASNEVLANEVLAFDITNPGHLFGFGFGLFFFGFVFLNYIGPMLLKLLSDLKKNFMTDNISVDEKLNWIKASEEKHLHCTEETKSEIDLLKQRLNDLQSSFTSFKERTDLTLLEIKKDIDSKHKRVRQTQLEQLSNSEKHALSNDTNFEIISNKLNFLEVNMAKIGTKLETSEKDLSKIETKLDTLGTDIIATLMMINNKIS